jgi:hypothetical protein
MHGVHTMDHPPLLFQLPRELRDEIYRHALYHAGGLLYTVGKNGVGRLCRNARNATSRKSILTTLYDRSRRVAKAQIQRRGREYNQLKHVCRQLRDESSALSPHGNVVFTEGSSTMNAFEQCLVLLQQFPKVRSVAIKCCASFVSESCQKLSKSVQPTLASPSEFTSRTGRSQTQTLSSVGFSISTRFGTMRRSCLVLRESPP